MEDIVILIVSRLLVRILDYVYVFVLVLIGILLIM